MLTWKYCTFCQDFVHSLRKVDFQPAVFKLTKKAGPTLTFALPQVKYCCLNHRLLHHPEDHEEPWPIVVKYKPGVSFWFSWWTTFWWTCWPWLADPYQVEAWGEMDKVLFILLSWCWSYLTWFSWPWCWPWCCIFFIFFCLLQSFIQPQCFWLCSLLRKKPGVSSCYLV